MNVTDRAPETVYADAGTQMAVFGALFLLAVCALWVHVSCDYQRRFRMLYFLYTKTFVGPMYHQRLIEMSRFQIPHTATTRINCGAYSVKPIAILQDNYAYLLIDHHSGQCALVDPSDADRVVEEFERERAHFADAFGVILHITQIYTTHKHHDHAGGNAELLTRFPNLEIYGGPEDVSAMNCEPCEDGETITLGAITTTVIYTPCHTKGHVVYYSQNTADPGDAGCLFSGDAVFVAGVGKFFEGDGAQMWDIIKKLRAAVPRAAKLFCGHEYTAQNLWFSKEIDPSNAAVATKLEWVRQQRKINLQTVPSTLAEEEATNPFFRADLPSFAELVIASPGTLDFGFAPWALSCPCCYFCPLTCVLQLTQSRRTRRHRKMSCRCLARSRCACRKLGSQEI